MSRREIFVNTLLGTILLLVFFARLAAIALIIWFGFVGLDWAFHLIVPGRTLPTGSLTFGILALSSLWPGVGHARKGRWRNAFLCFVRASLMGFAWFTPIESSLGGNGLAWFSWFPVIVIILTIEADETLGLLKFSLAAALAGVAMLANSGLLGDGKLAYTVANCDLAVAVAWCIAAFLIGRRNDSLDRPFTFPPVA